MAKASKTAKVLIGATAFGASFFDPDIRWRTQFSAPDPFVVVVHSGKTVLFVSELEYERAKKQARADEVLLIEKLREEFGLPKMAPASAWLPLYLKREGIDTLEVSPFYDTVLKLSKDFDMSIPKGPLFPERAVKTRDEIGNIKKVRDATEEVLDMVFRAIRGMDIYEGKIFDPKGVIGKKDDFLTAEVLRSFMNREFISRDCFCPDTIIASGNQAVDPHCIGFGPLCANVPIVFDVFPRSTDNLYWYDTTRTVVKGILRPEALALYDMVKAGQSLGLTMIKEGANGKDIHLAIDGMFVSAGYKTGLQKALVDGKEVMMMQGFFHGTGHGVGADIHESPRISWVDDTLCENMVVTCEPGLYYWGIGGVRIEDTVVVTKNGYNNLSRYTRELLEL